MIYLINKKQR